MAKQHAGLGWAGAWDLGTCTRVCTLARSAAAAVSDDKDVLIVDLRQHDDLGDHDCLDLNCTESRPCYRLATGSESAEITGTSPREEQAPASLIQGLAPPLLSPFVQVPLSAAIPELGSGCG